MTGLLTTLLAPTSRRSLTWTRGVGLGGSLQTSTAGVPVTERTALSLSSVYACVRVLAESVAALPLITYRRVGRGKERAPDHALFSLLHDLPNPEITAFELREILMSHILLWGNAYCEIVWSASGQVAELWPLRPDRMIVKREAGELVYIYDLPTGGEPQRLAAAQVHHWRGLGFDGVLGYSPIRMVMNSIGLGLATEEYGARFFSNGARPGVVLTHPGILGDEGLANVRDSFTTNYQGLENAHRVQVLEEGMSIETIGVPPEEAQFLETRRFQKNEIAGIYRVPPHMIADLERATFSNVEQQSLDFVIHSLTPWLVRIEQAIARDLLLPSERAGIFVEHLVAGLLRGDLASRYASYMTGRQGGWLSANDVRRFENMNPIDGGDEYLVPLNMIPAGDEPDEGRAFVPGGNGGVSLERERTNERYAELLDAIVATRDDEQTADDRRATARSFARVYRDAAQRLANREAADLRRAIDGRLTRDGLADFLAWLDGFYDDLRDVIPPLFEPVMMSLAEQVLDAVDAEIDEEVDRDVDDFVESYLDKYAGAYVTAHHRRLKKIADDEELKGDDELVAAALTAQVDHWQEIEPDRQGRDQPFEAANAVAIAAYAGAGIQFLRWLASGDSCEFCEALSGTVAGIDATFVVKGGTLPGVAGGVMRIGSSKRHGPLHEGCDCIVVPA